MEITYKNSVSSEWQRELVGTLYKQVFTYECDLDDIFQIVRAYERRVGISDDGSRAAEIFASVVALLEDGERTAQRLYECYFENYELCVAMKLLNQNSHWLSSEQEERIKAHLGNFDEGVRERLFWNWE